MSQFTPPVRASLESAGSSSRAGSNLSNGGFTQSISGSSQQRQLDDMLHEYESQSKSHDNKPQQSEFVMMVHFVGRIVRTVLESFIDVCMCIMLLVPLLCPWRTMAVFNTGKIAVNHFQEDWRLRMRTWAIVQVLLAMVDLVVGPFVLMAFLMPTRPLAIHEMLMRQAEAYRPLHMFGKSVDAQYNAFLRFFLLSQLLYGAIDLICVVIAIVALVHPWRTCYLLRGNQNLLTKMKEDERQASLETLDPDRLPFLQGRWNVKLNDLRRWWLLGSLGVFVDWIAFPLALVSLFVPTRTLAFFKEIRTVISETYVEFSASNSRVTIRDFPWKDVWFLCVSNCLYAVLDILVLPFIIVIIATMLRAAPLFKEVQRRWNNVPYMLHVRLDSNLRGGGKMLDQIRAQINKDSIEEGVPNTEVVVMPGLAPAKVTPATDKAQVAGLEVDHSSSSITVAEGPIQALPSSTTTTRTKSKGEGKSKETKSGTKSSKPPSSRSLQDEFGGKYILTSGFGSELRYCRVTHHGTFDDYEPCARPLYLVHRDGWWQLCLTEEKESVAVRWKFKDIRRHRWPQTRKTAVIPGSSKERDYMAQTRELVRQGAVAEYMRGEDCDDWVKIDTFNLYISTWTSGASTLQESAAFGSHGYNITLRMAILKQFGSLVLDLLLMPFFLLVLLSCYRRPSLSHSMQRDAENELASLLWLSEDGQAKFDKARKNGADKVYTAKLGHIMQIGDHGYTWSWESRYEVLRQTAFMFGEALLLPLFLTVFATVYRGQKLLTRFTVHNSSWHIAVIMNANMVLYDSLIAVPLFLVYATRYRWKYVVETRNKSRNLDAGSGENAVGDLEYIMEFAPRIEVVRQAALVCCDAVASPFLLLITATKYRLHYLDGLFQPRNLRWHAEVATSTAWICHDLLIMLPICSAFVFMLHRTNAHINLIRDPPNMGLKDAQNNVRLAMYIELFVCLMDILVLPGVLICLVTVYRWRHVGRYLPDVIDSVTQMHRGENMIEFHYQVVLNTIIVLHDVVFMFPASILIIVTIYRMRIIIDGMTALVHSLAIDIASFGQLFAGKKDDRARLVRQITEDRNREREVNLSMMSAAARVSRGSGRANSQSGNQTNAPITVERASSASTDGAPGSRAHTNSTAQSVLAAADPPSSSSSAEEAQAPLERDDASAGAQANRQRVRDEDDDSIFEDNHDVAPPERWYPDHQVPPQYQRATQRITQVLVGHDARWGDYLDWNALGRDDDEAFTRGKFWIEVISTIMDLPFLICGLFIVLALWRMPLLLQLLRRPQSDSSRRKIAFWQLVYTVRDILLMPFAFLLLLTPRGCSFIASLCARRRKPLRLDPLLLCTWVEVTAPDDPNTNREPFVLRLGTRRASQSLASHSNISRESLRIQVLGNGFWQSVSKKRGRAKTGIARSLLPFKPQNVDVFDATQVPTTMNTGPSETTRVDQGETEVIISLSSQGRHGLLKNVHGNEFIKIQLEGIEEIIGDDDNRIRRPCVFSSFVLKVSKAIQLTTPGATTRLSEDMLRDGEESPDFRNAVSKGLVESFAGLLANEGWQFFLDALHWIMAILLLLVPWRFALLISSLFEPEETWISRNASYLLECAEDADHALQKLRAELLPACNFLAKDSTLVKHWCQYGFVDSSRFFSGDAFREYKTLRYVMRKTLTRLPANVSSKVLYWLQVEDASFYYAAVRSYSNCLLSYDQITIEEQGVIIGRTRAAEDSFDKVREQARSGAIAAISHSANQSQGVGLSLKSFRSKDTSLRRSIIRTIVQTAIMDLLSLFGCIIIIVTLYRLPKLYVDIKAEKVRSFTSNRFKAVVLKQVVACMCDTHLVMHIFVLSLFVIITLVRLPEALHEVVFVVHSLTVMRDMLQRQAKEAVTSFWELFSLLTIVKTYKLLGKVIAHTVLVPPVCLGDFFNRLIGAGFQNLHLGIRLSICVAFFYMLALFPLLSVLLASAFNPQIICLVFLICVVSLLIGNMLSVTRTDESVHFRRYKSREQENEQVSIPTMRASWPNLIQVSSLYFNRTLLGFYLLCCHLHDHFGLLNACELGENLALFGIISAFLGMMLVALTFLVEQQADIDFRKSSTLLTLHGCFSKLCFVPTIIGLAGPLGASCHLETGLSAKDGVAIFMLAAYIVVTQMLSGESSRLRALSGRDVDDCEADARYPPLFGMGADLLDFLMVVTPVFSSNGTLQLVLACIFVCLSLVWVPFYRYLFKIPTCIVHHVVPLKVGCTVALSWVLLFIILTTSFSNEIDIALLAGIVLCLSVSFGAAYRAYTKARGERKHRLIKSSILECFEGLLAICDDLCVASKPNDKHRRDYWDAVLKGAPTATLVRACILEFEQHILAERLDSNFIAQHSEWVRRVQDASTFARLAPLVRVLHDSVRPFSSVPALTQLAVELLGRHDLAPNILNLLVGHRTLDALLDPVLLATSAGDDLDMEAHCTHARVALESLLAIFRDFSRLRENIMSENNANQGAQIRFQRNLVIPWWNVRDRVLAATSFDAYINEKMGAGIPSIPRFSFSFLSKPGSCIFKPSGSIVSLSDSGFLFQQYDQYVWATGPRKTGRQEKKDEVDDVPREEPAEKLPFSMPKRNLEVFF